MAGQDTNRGMAGLQGSTLGAPPGKTTLRQWDFDERFDRELTVERFGRAHRRGLSRVAQGRPALIRAVHRMCRFRPRTVSDFQSSCPPFVR